MANAIVVIGAIVAVAAVLWFLFGRTPEQAASHDHDPMSPSRQANLDGTGPADAGAEDMATPTPDEPGPSEGPRP